MSKLKQTEVARSEDATSVDLPGGLLRPEAFPHPVQHLQLLETHISWVLLTGKYAYKIKKPVQLPFVDYSTLNLRKHYCQEELRLNRLLAPNLYLGVVGVMDCCGKLSIEGDGHLIDCAVRMREFPQDSIFLRQLSENKVDGARIDELARLIADIHQRADVADEDALEAVCSATNLYQQSMENIEYLKRFFRAGTQEKALLHVAEWISEKFSELEPIFRQRIRDGFVRRLHGDMHLQNIIVLDGAVQVFDCIEFTPELQWIDCLNDVAFPLMDLQAHGKPEFAHRALTIYLEQTGDYAGLPLLEFFMVYRALVRAKVTLMRDENSHDSLEFAARYLMTAADLTQQRTAKLWITFGMSGSGKSTSALSIAESEGAIRIRSDVERSRMFADSSAAEKYSEPATSVVYRRLAELSEHILRCGFSVVVDATFLKRHQRSMFADLAGKLSIPMGIIECKADEEILRSRIAQRKDDASEATAELIQQQSQLLEPLSDDESRMVCQN